MQTHNREVRPVKEEYLVQQADKHGNPGPRHDLFPLPERKRMMSAQIVAKGRTLPSLKSLNMPGVDRLSPSITLPRTPPDSIYGSPEHVSSPVSTPSSTPPETSPVCKTENARDLVLGSPFSLPSITDFDKGVEALAKSSDCPPAKAPATPPPDLRKHSIGFHMQNDHHPQYRHSRDHMGYQLQYQAPHSYPGRFMRRGLYQGQVDMPYFDFNKPPASYMAEAAYRDSFSSDGGQELSLDSDADRHINQKYSTEEGDWIIYAMHEEGLKWNACKEAFARRFGTTPHRSVQGLQAWYYRMNGRIPVWDADGWLCFDNEDEIEPKYVAIKCRSRDAVGSSSEQLGLIQRYPERAIQYDWVGIEHKYKARDWASKRETQYRERRERRRRREHRRIKL